MYACFAKEISTISHRAGIKIKRSLAIQSNVSCPLICSSLLNAMKERSVSRDAMHPRDSIFQLGVRAFAANNRPASISVTNRAHNKTLFFTVSVAEHERDGSTKERERKKESIERAFHGASKSALRTNLLNFTLARCGKNPPPLLRKFT